VPQKIQIPDIKTINGIQRLLSLPRNITMQSPIEKQAGSLTIVGSGIESIGQITLQAISHIEAAAKVFYCIVDPATEAFILTKNKNCVDLYQFYDNGKPRMDTYTQMAEVYLCASLLKH
jgi:hypothetical protein